MISLIIHAMLIDYYTYTNISPHFHSYSSKSLNHDWEFGGRQFLPTVKERHGHLRTHKNQFGRTENIFDQPSYRFSRMK